MRSSHISLEILIRTVLHEFIHTACKCDSHNNYKLTINYCSTLQDPHFYGRADRLPLQNNGWVQWKHLEDVFKRESFYNFCLPQLRSEEYD